MTQDQQPNHEAASPTNCEAVRSGDWLGDAERLAASLEKKAFELDRRRRALRKEADFIDELHTWLNAQRHAAAAVVARAKAASTSDQDQRTAQEAAHGH